MGRGNIIGFRFFTDYYADVGRRRVLRGNVPLPVPLTGREFDVLRFFLERPRTVIPRDEILPLHDVTRSARDPADDYIAKIRKKLGLGNKQLFSLTRKVGYRLDADVHPVLDIDEQRSRALYRASIKHFDQHTVASMRTALSQSLQLLNEHPDGIADAHVEAAYEYINLSHAAFSAELPSVVVPKAREEAEHALAKDPTLASAYGVLGLISLIYDYDWAEALKQIHKALELDPNQAATLLTYAHYLVSSGRVSEATSVVEQAAIADLDDQLIGASVAWIYLFAGKLDSAVTLARDFAHLYPVFAPSHMILGWIQEAQGDYGAAEISFLTSLKLDSAPIAIASLGHLYGARGQSSLAKSMLRDLSRLQRSGDIAYVSGYCEALIRVGLNDFQGAMIALRRAYDERCDWLIHLAVDPRWKPLRKYKTFISLAKRVGIPTTLSSNS